MSLVRTNPFVVPQARVAMARHGEYEIHVPRYRKQDTKQQSTYYNPPLSARVDEIDGIFDRIGEIHAMDTSKTDVDVYVEENHLYNKSAEKIRLFFVLANATFNLNCANIAYDYIITPECRQAQLREVLENEMSQDALEQMLASAGLVCDTLVGHLGGIRGKRAVFAHDVFADFRWEGELRPWAVRAVNINDVLLEFSPQGWKWRSESEA